MSIEKNVDKLKELNFDISFIRNKFIKRYEGDDITILNISEIKEYINLIAEAMNCGLLKTSFCYGWLECMANKKVYLIGYSQNESVEIAYFSDIRDMQRTKRDIPVYFTKEFWKMFEDFYNRVGDKKEINLVIHGLKEIGFEDEKIDIIIKKLNKENN